MKERVLSCVVIVALTSLIFVLSGYTVLLCAIIALISCAALYEVLSITHCAKNKWLLIFSLILAAIIPFFPEFRRQTYIIGVFVFALILFITMLIGHRQFKLEQIAITFLMSVIIPFFFSTIIYMRDFSFGGYYMVMAFGCAWFADTGGYIFGKLFGKHKLAPEISPKKTVEGAIGGVILNVVGMVLIGVSAQIISHAKVNYWLLIIVAIIGAVVSLLGDLTASQIKRNFNTKDFGSLIPGHGGIMDRFDSVLFCAPYIYVCVVLLTKICETGAVNLYFFSV